jgi:dTMP kinase
VPVLKTGAVVLADRYAYTACARDVARGLSRKWARNLYSFAIRPNAVFYFRLLPEEALARLTAGRRVPGHYEAGMDIGLSRSIDESFRLFQGRVTAEYDAMAREDVFHIIDATLSVEEQQQELRQAVMSVLVEERRSHAASAAQVL